jgi:hypothetical protein
MRRTLVLQVALAAADLPDRPAGRYLFFPCSATAFAAASAAVGSPR